MTHLRIWFLALLATASCQKSSSVAAKCVMGQSIECACSPGVHGIQTCRADGTFENCHCRGDSESVGETALTLSGITPSEGSAVGGEQVTNTRERITRARRPRIHGLSWPREGDVMHHQV